MALLKLASRKKIFKTLGLGEYNKANIKKFQRKYFAKESQATGKYGTKTDILLRHVYYVKKYTKDFSPEEFKCGCGGKYCNGYPTYMKPAQLDLLQTVRTKYKKPVKITCGLRCPGYNKALSGSVSNSKHLEGRATDFYMAGVTDTLVNRKNAITYLKSLKNFNYAYGNGYASNGTYPNTPNMGNALHVDTVKNKVTNPQGKLKTTTTESTKTSTTETNANSNPKISPDEKLVKTAKALCWPYGSAKSKWDYKTGRPTTSCKAVMTKYGYDKKIQLSDCGNFAKSMARYALGHYVDFLDGTNDPFPKAKGFKIVFKGTQIKKSDLKPGDFVRYKRDDSNGKMHQHVGMYYGKVTKNGKTIYLFAEAGRGTRFAVIHPASKFFTKKKQIQILRAVED